jgi:O-antigen ligase
MPFENTPYKVAPLNIKPAFRSPHNPFLRILFHQGIVGLIPYVLLLIIATLGFLKEAFASDNLKSYILIACASIMIGTFLVFAIVQNSKLTDLVLILGIGIAAKNLKSENSNN